MDVDVFIPCFMDQLFPQTAFNTIKVLERAGCKVRYNPEQTCCGQPAYNAGYWDEAKKVGTKFLDDFNGVKHLVSPSASCTGMVWNGYNDLFTNSMVHNQCRSLQQNMHELSDFLVNIVKKEYFGAELEGKAVYHDSCAGLRECHIRREPRQLLGKVEGLELLDLPDGDTCCGFGGTFSVKFEAIASAMAEQKVEHALSTGADYIISTDASCLLHLQAYIDQKRLRIRTMHLADVLANGWGNI